MIMNCSSCKKNNLLHFETKLGINYDYPIFSFKHLVINKEYNFSKIPENELKDFCKLLIETIQKLETQYTTKSLFSMKKSNIFESFSIERLKFKPTTLKYSNDTKVYIFRVTSDYRMICIFSDVAPIFHVIGFDFRYNAYNHGS